MNIDEIISDGVIDSEWYTFDNTDIRVHMRHPNTEDVERITKQCTKTKRRRGQKVEELNDKMLKHELADFCILDWEGIESKGEAWPCTRDNKILFTNKSTKFSTFWNNIISDSMDADYEAAAEESGN